jgi:hypothetical protein
MLSEALWLALATSGAAVDLPDPPPPPEGAAEVAVTSLDEEPAEPPPPLLPSEPAWSGRERMGMVGRFSFGPAYLWGHYEGMREYGEVVGRRMPIEGFAASAEMMVGGAPLPGLILGTRLGLTTAPGAVFRDGDTSETLEPLYLLQGGFIVDWYLVADGGFHVFASTGLALLPDPDPLHHDLASGIAWSGGVGYELWLSEVWSAGITLRVDGAHLGADTGSPSETNDFFFACPSLQLSFTVN